MKVPVLTITEQSDQESARKQARGKVEGVIAIFVFLYQSVWQKTVELEEGKNRRGLTGSLRKADEGIAGE